MAVDHLNCFLKAYTVENENIEVKSSYTLIIANYSVYTA